jgi:hypothetical protein
MLPLDAVGGTCALPSARESEQVWLASSMLSVTAGCYSRQTSEVEMTENHLSEVMVENAPESLPGPIPGNTWIRSHSIAIFATGWLMTASNSAHSLINFCRKAAMLGQHGGPAFVLHSQRVVHESSGVIARRR